MRSSKDIESVKYPKTKAMIGIVLLMILITAFIIQHTVVMRIYTVSYMVNVILNNMINIIAVSALLIFMNFLEIKIIKKRIENG